MHNCLECKCFRCKITASDLQKHLCGNLFCSECIIKECEFCKEIKNRSYNCYHFEFMKYIQRNPDPKIYDKFIQKSKNIEEILNKSVNMLEDIRNGIISKSEQLKHTYENTTYHINRLQKLIPQNIPNEH